MLGSFFGGVNPDTHKQNTRRKPIAPLEYAPEQVCIPLSTTPQTQATPIVKVGERVCVGQPIAAGEGAAVPEHASISGRVKDIKDCPHPLMGQCRAIVIENDGQNTPWAGMPAGLPPEQVTLELLLARTQDAGIVGMGGGAYPTAQKLAQAAGNVDTLIVNAAECEPYITADHRLLLERSDKILVAAHTLARVLGAQRAVVVTEGDKLNAAETVERRIRRRMGSSGKVSLRTARTRYPLGAERQIVQTVTRREISLGKTAIDVGCVVLNVATVFAIQEALFTGAPLTHRVVTVAGDSVVRPRNLWVPIGTDLQRLLKAAGGLREKTALVLMGGPMTGVRQSTLAAPVIKTTNALVCLSKKECRANLPTHTCLRCGKCVASCPMHLAPTFVNRYLQEHEWDKLQALHPQDCMQCGCCSYICPARIPLLELVGQANELLKQREAQP